MTGGGSRWYRVDFHLHTPGVRTFAPPSGVNLDDPRDRQRIAEQYAERLATAGIDVAAITDYNGIRDPWFTLIREAAAHHGVLVLPGAELSIEEGKGVHILAIFPQNTDVGEINECLRGLDRSPGRQLWTGRKFDELRPRVPLAEVLSSLRQRFRCLLIPAHGDDGKGIIRELGAEASAQLILDVDIDALDHAGGAIGKLRSTGLGRHRWDHLALVEFSDPKRIEDIAGKQLPDGRQRGTWLKLSSLELDSIRLALHDPQTRLATVEPRAPANARLVSVSVDGAGFLGKQSIEMNADLTALIGGRGAGKSAILETIRYGLGVEPICEGDVRREAVKNALGSGGVVTIEVERCAEAGSGKRYRIERVFGEDPRVFDCDTQAVVKISPVEAFGPNREPIVLLQREIHEVSKDPEYRRRLLDMLIGERVRDAERRVEEVRDTLEDNAQQLTNLVREQERRAELQLEVNRLEHELGVFEGLGVMEKLSQHTKLSQVRASLDAARVEFAAMAGNHPWRQALQEVANGLHDIGTTMVELGTDDTGIVDDSRVLVANAVQAIANAERTVLAAVQAGRDGMATLIQRHDDRAAPLSEQLNTIKQELHADKLDADYILGLSAKLSTLKPKLAALERKLPMIERLTADRERLLDQLAHTRSLENRVRRQSAEEIAARLSGRLVIDVRYKGDIEDYREALQQLLQGSRATKATISQLTSGEAPDGHQVAKAVRQGTDALAATFGITPAQAAGICNMLTSKGEAKLHALESLAPKDRVDLKLVVDGDARPLDRLSAGQRATAILLLIFAVDERCMLLDQPEDDLDNRFVFDDIVQMVRAQKATLAAERARQIVAATHNPNIPVLGDAEQVLVLDVQDQKAAVVASGSIDSREIRQHLRQILEGGAEAFRRRFEKYGGVL